ncbi:MAG: peptidylprolyl isomerase [Deltaproteobacteria bacterium]|nr:peptidylprolyl isomerase [Deltaproteobacteria bacterium]
MAIIVAVVVVIGAVIIGYPYYQAYLAPWNEPVLTVRDTVFDMRYYMKLLRLHMTGSEKDKFAITMRVIEKIQESALIEQEAVKLKIGVSNEEVAREIRRRVLESSKGEGEYEDLYENLLRGLRLSEKDYTQLVKQDLFKAKLLNSFEKGLPDKVEHVHVFAIVTGRAEKAEELRKRLGQGEDFNKLAREESIDLSSSKKGGDLGWIPKGVDERTATAQVLLQGILTKTKADAENVRARLAAGEDFSELARKVSMDDATRSQGGYLGWVSTDFQRGGKQYGAESYELEPGSLSEPIDTGEGFWVTKLLEKVPEGKVIDDYAFGLETGQVTPPLFTRGGYYLIEVAGRENRNLVKEHKKILAHKALKNWLRESATKGSEEGWIKWNWGSEPLNWALDHL